jgi:hypothetical protein
VPGKDSPCVAGRDFREEIAWAIEQTLPRDVATPPSDGDAGRAEAAETDARCVEAPSFEPLELELTPAETSAIAEACGNPEPLVLELTPAEMSAIAEACGNPEPLVLEATAPSGEAEVVDDGFEIAPSLGDEGNDEVATAHDATDPTPPAATAPAITGEGGSTPAGAAASEVADPADAFTAFVGALVAVALAMGATRTAAVLPKVLEARAGALPDVPAESEAVLLSARIAERAETALVLSEGFVRTASAWRSVLRGETNDLSACGTSTLDGWGAELLKALGVGDGKSDVRKELRRRGVAAFGMLAAA